MPPPAAATAYPTRVSPGRQSAGTPPSDSSRSVFPWWPSSGATTDAHVGSGM